MNPTLRLKFKWLKSLKVWIIVCSCILVLSTVLLFYQFLRPIIAKDATWVWLTLLPWYIKLAYICASFTILGIPILMFFYKKRHRSYIVITVVSIVLLVIAILLFLNSANKTPLDFLQSIATLILFSIGSYIKVRDDQNKQREKELENLRLDRLESEHAIHDYTESLIELTKDGTFKQPANSMTPDEIEKREYNLNAAYIRTLIVFMRVTYKDKLQLVILLKDKHLVEKDNAMIPLKGDDLSCIDFSKYTIGHFEKLNFHGTNLKGAKLDGKSFKGTDFSESDLTDATFNGADLSGANLLGATYDKEALSKAHSLMGTILTDGYVNQNDSLDIR